MIYSFFILFILIILLIFIYSFFVKKKWIKPSVHPYTLRKDKRMVLDFIQISLLVLAGFLCLTYHQFFVSVLLFLVSSGCIALFRQKNKQSKWGTVYWTWDGSELDSIHWKKIHHSLLGNTSIRESRPFPTQKILFTERFVFLNKKKHLSIHRNQFEQLDLRDVYIKENSLVFVYAFNKQIDLLSYVIAIPKKKKQEAQKIMVFYQTLLKKK